MAAAALAILAGCAGSSNSTQQVTTTPTSSVQTVSVGISDAPGDRVTAFTVTINAINLVNASGTSVPLVTTPTTIEVTHLAGTTFPLGHAAVPQGTYAKATVTIANPVVTFLSPVTGQPVQKTLPAGPTTLTVAINPPLVVGASAVALNFDLNVFGSISIDASGNVTFTPQFGEHHGDIGEGPEDPFHGEIDHAAGTIGAVSGSTFTLKVLAGQQTLTFKTDSNTKFDGISGLNGLTSGMLVVVEADTQSDGTLLAKEVRAMIPPGGIAIPAMEIEGVIFATTGTPATQLQLTFHEGEGLMSSMLAGTLLNVGIGSGTVFSIDAGDVDLHSLPFTPGFDASSVHAGQRIEAEGAATAIGGTTAPTFNATKVHLESQGVAGTIAAINGNVITLTLPADSSLAMSSKIGSVTVYKQSGTDVEGTLAVGSKVTARGLLFFDAGTFKLVASHIETE